jgi:hypothetical protein
MGVISGIVSKHGVPWEGARVCGKLPGLYGMTREVRTDRHGRFLLEWSADSSYVETVYVNGSPCDHNIDSGNANLHYTVD